MTLRRTHTANNAEIVTFGGAIRHRLYLREPNQAVSMSTRMDPKFNSHLSQFKNPANAPYHWHSHQREDFLIETGSVIFHLDGKDVVKTKADGLISIHPGTYHTFRADPTSLEEICVRVTAPRNDPGLNEQFIRNIYSYMEDCTEQKIKPNTCQLFLFLYSTDTYPALPGPKFIAQPLSRYLTWFLGVVVGKHILGFKESYEEYYNPAATKVKHFPVHFK